MDKLLENKELLGVFVAIIGLITAVVNRKKIIETRVTSTNAYSLSDDTGSTGSGLTRRFKKLLLCVVLSFVGLFIIGSLNPNEHETVFSVIVWPVLIVMIMTMYQLTAIVLVIGWRTLKSLA